MSKKDTTSGPHEIDRLLSLERIGSLARQLHLSPPSSPTERGELRAQLIDELKFLRDSDAPPPADPGCICRGNWRLILKETELLLEKKFSDKNGEEFNFFGVVHGKTDYYYGMYGKSGVRLLSCAGSIEGHGFTLVESGLHNPHRASR